MLSPALDVGCFILFSILSVYDLLARRHTTLSVKALWRDCSRLAWGDWPFPQLRVTGKSHTIKIKKQSDSIQNA